MPSSSPPLLPFPPWTMPAYRSDLAEDWPNENCAARRHIMADTFPVGTWCMCTRGYCSASGSIPGAWKCAARPCRFWKMWRKPARRRGPVRFLGPPGTFVYLAGQEPGPGMANRLAGQLRQAPAADLQAGRIHDTPLFAGRAETGVQEWPGHLHPRPGAGHDHPDHVQAAAGPHPIWAPDGKHIVFRSACGQLRPLVDSQRRCGRSPAPAGRPRVMAPWSFSPDGRAAGVLEDQPRYRARYLDPAAGSHRSRSAQSRASRSRSCARRRMSDIRDFLPTAAGSPTLRTNPGSWKSTSGPFPAASGGKWQISSGGGLYAFLVQEWA